MGMEPQRRVGRVTDAFTYAELDEILRGTVRTGAIGISAIDGLIAALVAAPSFVHPDEWIPLIFSGRQPPCTRTAPSCAPSRRSSSATTRSPKLWQIGRRRI